MSKDQVPFYKIPDAPASVTAGAIMGRLADSVGFRFRWAVEGLVDADLAFKPAPDCMTHGELILHIHDLLVGAARNAAVPPGEPLSETSSCGQMISGVLDLSSRLSRRYKAMSDTDLAACTPGLWTNINGHLADCLTHIGQILSWRRLAGAPPAPPDHFGGLPPAGA
jgi:hypothetical protein